MKLFFLQLNLCVFMLLACISISAQNAAGGQPQNSQRVMTYNIRNAHGLDGKTDIRRIADVIQHASPDVVALQELDSVTGRSNQVDVLKELADLTGMHAVYGASINFDGGKYGIGILSKNKPVSWERIPLPGREEARSLLIVEFPAYFFYCTHFSLKADDRAASVDIIDAMAAKQHKPVILAGDLNDSPASPVINTLMKNWEMLTDPDAFTFPANKANTTIDYIMGYTNNKQRAYTVLKKEVLKEPVASDHLPVFVDIIF